MQHTLKTTAIFTGQGLHSGAAVSMHVHPAPVDHGIWFRRSDVADADAMIPARWDAVVPSKPVSYTHLDVYKRQAKPCFGTGADRLIRQPAALNPA